MTEACQLRRQRTLEELAPLPTWELRNTCLDLSLPCDGRRPDLLDRLVERLLQDPEDADDNPGPRPADCAALLRVELSMASGVAEAEGLRPQAAAARLPEGCSGEEATAEELKTGMARSEQARVVNGQAAKVLAASGASRQMRRGPPASPARALTLQVLQPVALGALQGASQDLQGPRGSASTELAAHTEPVPSRCVDLASHGAAAAATTAHPTGTAQLVATDSTASAGTLRRRRTGRAAQHLTAAGEATSSPEDSDGVKESGSKLDLPVAAGEHDGLPDAVGKLLLKRQRCPTPAATPVAVTPVAPAAVKGAAGSSHGTSEGPAVSRWETTTLASGALELSRLWRSMAIGEPGQPRRRVDAPSTPGQVQSAKRGCHAASCAVVSPAPRWTPGARSRSRRGAGLAAICQAAAAAAR